MIELVPEVINFRIMQSMKFVCALMVRAVPDVWRALTTWNVRADAQVEFHAEIGESNL